MTPTPILLISDNPSLPSGLARFCRDLATLCCTMPEFRVAVLGRGCGNNRRFPFTMYSFPESAQWGETYIEQTWDDFSAGQDGIIMTLDDVSRRHWFANPTGLPTSLQKFLGRGRSFKKWGYFPVDGTGPNGKSLSAAGVDCISRYDRVLAASEFGCGVLRYGGRTDADWLPHGIWTDKFKAHPKPLDSVTITCGCVMANQSRKDYPAAFECFAALKSHFGNRFRAWIHTNQMIGYWNLYALAADYGISDCLDVTVDLSDHQLSMRYSDCSVTILPSAGEGFGYPIAESLACGTACIVTDYAAGASLVTPEFRIPPVAYRVDTQHNVLRAVLSGLEFARAAMAQIEQKQQDWDFQAGRIAAMVEHLDWNKLKYPWKKWLLGGLA